MRYISFVLIFGLLLSFTSCADKQSGSAPAEPTGSGTSAQSDESNADDPEDGDVIGLNPGDPGRTYNIHLSKAFKALCRDAYEAADRYLSGTATARETQNNLFEIVERMVEEHNTMPEGDSASAAAGAIMMTRSLHDYVYKDSFEDKEKFRLWRDALKKFAEHK